MPALIPTDYTAEIVWLGVVTSTDRQELMSEVRDTLDLRFDGIAGSVHGGLTRASCSRVKSQYPKGTDIRNERQLSIVSEEELGIIAQAMGVEASALDPARLGASMVIRGIHDFSHVPPSSRLQAPSGATVAIDMLNQPCQFPAKSLRHVLGDPAKGFKSAAEGHRGVTAWVAREGRVAVGDTLTLHIPGQRHWHPHA
ncbi:MOSC domain-containing protein [Primorskyibacter sp. 2E107]|uniref:MOSC domain-containing protein n=1 Tax=Primorskyibacter sp. 2E107 TaxID=3403458 RepID=UPI003AF5E417